jgi:holliday junction DNA helicase RuvA
MIAFIKGKIEEYGEEYVIIDNNGIGYFVNIPGTEIEKIKSNRDMIKLYTYQHVREDYIGLYGFLDKERLNMFKMLLNVTGVGPKVAIGLTSGIEPQSIILAIITEDEKTLCKAQGVGKKMAQRIILELKDKFKSYDFLSQNHMERAASSNDNGYSNSDITEALGALMALGYTNQEAASALKNIDLSNSIEEIVKQALKSLMRG